MFDQKLISLDISHIVIAELFDFRNLKMFIFVVVFQSVS